MQTGSVIGGLGGSALSRSAPVSSLRTCTHVWSADVQGKIVIWDPQRMAVVREVELGRGEAVFSMCQVGRSVWIGTAGHIYCVDLLTFAMFNWRAHERPINDLLYHDDCVWTASNDGTIKVRSARVDSFGLRNIFLFWWSQMWIAGNTPQDVILTKEFNVLPGSILCLQRLTLPEGQVRICGGHTDGTIYIWHPQARCL